MTLAPPAKPRLTTAELMVLLARHGHRLPVLQAAYPVILVGIRGYYRDTMGAPGRNDRGLYDDAIVLLSPNGLVTYNANTDPSTARPGIASLKPGQWLYRLGTHGLSRPKAQQYQALVQAAEVTVARDGRGDDTGWFGINIHRGGITTTSSLGCQTIPPDQWPAFISLVKQELQRAGQKTLPYLLIEPCAS